jgi:hypothetical protein
MSMAGRKAGQSEAMPAKFVGIIDSAPDEPTAITCAIVKYYVPPDGGGRLMARRRV